MNTVLLIVGALALWTHQAINNVELNIKNALLVIVAMICFCLYKINGN